MSRTNIYIGFVKSVVDTKYSGRLRVWVPELGSRESDSESWILCSYCSPFGGTTSWRSTSESEYDTYEKTQSSYGFWAVPPDLDNEVLVLVPGGDLTRAVWIGSIFKDFSNYSLPGLGISDKNKNKNGTEIPVAEYNKHDKSTDTSVPTHAIRPWHRFKTEGIGRLGLIKDRKRGIINGSSMRESPSNVYGWSTPGPKHPDIKGSRLGGHSFVMDDGIDSEYIMLRTRSGGMIKIDETDGFIYAITPTGNSWVQMDPEGNVDFFGAKSFSVRSKEDINLKSDRNINIEAGQNINIKAAKNTNEDLEYDEDNGIGGNINIVARSNLHSTISESIFQSVQTGNYNVTVGEGDYKVLINGSYECRTEKELFFSVKEKSQITLSDTLVHTGNLEIGSSILNIISDSTTITSDNIKLDENGNLIVSGSIYAGEDVSSSSQSLNELFEHTHLYIDTKPDGTPVESESDVFGADPFIPDVNAYDPSDTEDFDDPDGPVDIPVIEKDDVLSTFPNTTIKTNGNKNIEIPDWWNRDGIRVETIASRLNTYEPCPEHFDREDE